MKTIHLKNPIQQGTETICQLELRNPKAKDFRKLPAEAHMLDLLSVLSGYPASVIDELSVEDMVAALEVVSDFFPSGQDGNATTVKYSGC